jgi:hypothetical protein
VAPSCHKPKQSATGSKLAHGYSRLDARSEPFIRAGRQKVTDAPGWPIFVVGMATTTSIYDGSVGIPDTPACTATRTAINAMVWRVRL